MTMLRILVCGAALMVAGASSAQTASGPAAAFQEQLQKLSWKDENNLGVDYRWAGGQLELLPTYAAELVSAQPDVILVNGAAALSV